jgi:hypothetical protein
MVKVKRKAVPELDQSQRHENLSLCRMALLILNFCTRCKWSVSFTPQALYPRGKSPGTHWIGGCLDLRANLDAVAKRECLPLRGNKPWSSTILTELLQLLRNQWIIRKPLFIMSTESHIADWDIWGCSIVECIHEHVSWCVRNSVRWKVKYTFTC